MSINLLVAVGDTLGEYSYIGLDVQITIRCHRQP